MLFWGELRLIKLLGFLPYLDPFLMFSFTLRRIVDLFSN